MGGRRESICIRSLVSAAVTVVWCREDGDNVALVAPVVAIHDKLMSTGDERQAVVVVEGLADVLAKGVASATRGNAPSAAVVGVGPEQIAHRALVRHLLNAV